MLIKFSCSHCHKVFNVKGELAGKRTVCPGCKKPITVPTPARRENQVDVDSMAAALLAEEKKAAPVEDTRTVDFNCPQCDEPIKIPIDLQGKQAPCPECRKIIKVREHAETMCLLPKAYGVRTRLRS
jgi:uncharacterized paraquat-inducible protein A